MAKDPWRPTWWDEDTHGKAWDRVREFMIRDRTHIDQQLHRPEGQLQGEAQEAARRAFAGEISADSSAPTAKEVYGDPDHIEVPLGYGVGARQQYVHEHPTWNNDLENQLRNEWERGGERKQGSWDEVRHLVQRGYEHKG